MHDRLRLGRRRQRLIARGEVAPRAWARLDAEIETAIAARIARGTARSAVRYPEALPVVERREEIAAAIAAHQVVVVCGETGSGKSTQLPKICLELGRGVEGMIGHTQPRRIAARSVAGRIATELDRPLGTTVGFRVRFTDRVAPETSIKLMTDGVLLSEIPYDRDLTHYDTLIIDEAHERSLNIDFLIGYLPRVLTRRPDLRLVVTSATIDPERFSRHFGGAPVIEVSGRTYPVEVRYRPLPERERSEEDRRAPALIRAVADTVDECVRSGGGDVLVFLPGEREIREAAHAIGRRPRPGLEVLPLFARLSPAEQDRVFAPHRGTRVVLATNVAETSLTVPGIRYVVDSGLARISRYAPGRKIQRLPVEPVARDSAEQRCGRAGRTAPGVCIRLYEESDFQSRPEYTEPEVQRASLAAVCLRMLDLGLGAPGDFPFIDPPTPRRVRDGEQQLRELGAVDADGRLTRIGRRLARLPIDPRLGRILLEAGNSGCLREALVVTAALAIPDPRVAPADAREAARESHRTFQVAGSDFLSLLRLWERYHEQRASGSRRALRRWCDAHYLSALRMIEWVEVHRQLAVIARELGLPDNDEPAPPDALHRALLAGLLGNIARREDDGTYRGARGRRLALFPASGLHRKGPKWLVAAELIETSRLYAHTVGPVRPEWIEQAAGDQVRRTYLEPEWDPRSGRVQAFEQVSLYGLVLIARRAVDFGRIDPRGAREIFIREALANDGGGVDAPFLARNRALLARIEALEQRVRRRDLAPGEERLCRLYDGAIPDDVRDRASLAAWLRRAPREESGAAAFRMQDLLQGRFEADDEARYPARIVVNGIGLDVEYRFAPGEEDDGFTVVLPLRLLGQLDLAALAWPVPGRLEEKATALLRGLPRELRRRLVPVPDTVRDCLPHLQRLRTRPFAEALAAAVRGCRGVELAATDLDESTIAEYLRTRLRIVDDGGHTLAAGRDIAALARRFARASADAFASAAPAGDTAHMTRWELDELPETLRVQTPDGPLTAWPALVDHGDAVAVEPRPTPESAAAASRDGLRRLLLLELPQHARHLARGLPGIQRLCTLFAATGSCERLREDLVRAITDRAFALDQPLPRTRGAFAQRREAAARAIPVQAAEVCRVVERTLEAHHGARLALARIARNHPEAAADMRAQAGELVYEGFVSKTPDPWLGELPRFLQGITLRAERLQAQPARDAARMAELSPLLARWQSLRGRRGSDDTTGEEARWMLEELRISLFAQDLGTRMRVSVKRVRERLDAAAGS